MMHKPLSQAMAETIAKHENPDIAALAVIELLEEWNLSLYGNGWLDEDVKALRYLGYGDEADRVEERLQA